MADERGAKPKVEFKVELEDAGEKDAGRRAAPDAGASAPADDEVNVGEAVREGAGHVRTWVRRTFPGGEGAFWGGVVGLVAAAVFLVLGIWYTAVIAVFVLVGVSVGQAIDGDPKIVNFIRSLFSHNQ